MIVCPVCGTRNHHLDTVCVSCGGFVQARVENLDLFSTIWQLIERPRRAFHQIAIARYKNYSTIVSALAGIGFVFAFFWYVRAGDAAPSALNLLLGGLAAGPVAGALLTVILALVVHAALALAGTRVAFRNLYAVLAWATVPVLLGAVFLLPLEVFTFGRYFFTDNPPPWLLKPVSYYLIVGLAWGVAAWTIALAATGMRALLECTRTAAGALAAGMTAVVLAAGWVVAWFLSAPR